MVGAGGPDGSCWRDGGAGGWQGKSFRWGQPGARLGVGAVRSQIGAVKDRWGGVLGERWWVLGYWGEIPDRGWGFHIGEGVSVRSGVPDKRWVPVMG